MSRAIEAKTAIGLSSGTSMDGIDAALVRFEGDVGARSIELVAFDTYPYEPALADELRRAVAAALPADLALLGVLVGEAFAAAAATLAGEAGVEMGEVDVIGSHGQTIVHVPEPTGCAGSTARASLQIGDPAVIAERTGVTTVADFRTRDLAAGGQGAPLVPLLDHVIYADAAIGRVALNLGGIANVTGLPPGSGLDGVIAFDTGPGNVLLDAAARRLGLADGFDRDGVGAAAGSVREDVLERLLGHPFFDREPPKSADTGDFLGPGEDGLPREVAGLEAGELLATLTELTARTVAEGIIRFVAPRQPIDEVLVSGGGAHNRTLTGRVAELAPAVLRPADEVAAIPGDAKEAVAFALLAAETLAGRPGNVPSATGAAGPRVLGSITPGV